MTAPIHDTNSFLVEAPGASGALRVDVALPPDYPEAGVARTPDPLPLILVLDGDFGFPAAATLSRLLMLGDARPHIVAGVGYPDGGSIARATERRVFDLTVGETALPLAPEQPQPRTGGGEAFLSALKKHVLPGIMARYAIDERSIFLCGTSLSGLFAGEAILRDRGELFAGVALLSSAFFYGDRRVLEALKTLSKDDVALGFQAYVCVGSLEEEGSLAGGRLLTDSNALMDAWRASGFPFQGAVLDGETHLSAFAPAYTRVVRSFLPIAPENAAESPLEFNAFDPVTKG